jgi:hypothetical protein
MTNVVIVEVLLCCVLDVIDEIVWYCTRYVSLNVVIVLIDVSFEINTNEIKF